MKLSPLEDLRLSINALKVYPIEPNIIKAMQNNLSLIDKKNKKLECQNLQLNQKIDILNKNYFKDFLKKK